MDNNANESATAIREAATTVKKYADGLDEKAPTLSDRERGAIEHLTVRLRLLCTVGEAMAHQLTETARVLAEAETGK